MLLNLTQGELQMKSIIDHRFLSLINGLGIKINIEITIRMANNLALLHKTTEQQFNICFAVVAHCLQHEGMRGTFGFDPNNDFQEKCATNCILT